MGIFNHFRPLKEHAEKLVRFKQDVSIRAAADGGLIDDNHLKLVSGGACAAFVMDWIAQQLWTTTKFSFDRGAGATKDDNFSTLEAALAAPKFASYVTVLSATSQL